MKFFVQCVGSNPDAVRIYLMACIHISNAFRFFFLLCSGTEILSYCVLFAASSVFHTIFFLHWSILFHDRSSSFFSCHFICFKLNLENQIWNTARDSSDDGGSGGSSSDIDSIVTNINVRESQLNCAMCGCEEM